ncbi:MAG TPA: MipA/OmpV family protein [Rhizomicrobium sp.]
MKNEMQSGFALIAIIAAIIAACVALPSPGFAAGLNRQQPPEWDITLGAGAVMRPTFEGSDRYLVSPIPFVQVTWDDMVSLGVGGLSAYWHHDHFKIGAGLTFDQGRDIKKPNIFGEGDDRLKGLGKIGTALGVRGFASYQLGPVNFDVSATKFTGSPNNGVLVNFGAQAPFKIASKLMVAPHINTTWANQNYMETFFGVTPIQSRASLFPQYAAGAGVKDVMGGVNVIYHFNPHWYVAGDASVTQFLDSAAKSPVSFSNTNVMVATMVGYHF